LTTAAVAPFQIELPAPVIPRSFYQFPTIVVARDLIGKRLVSRTGRCKTSGIIVETEAYLAEHDPACHGARGPTRSNASMFGAAGHAYVYPIHAGFCLNVVTGQTGQAEAVLIRAVKPSSGIGTMMRRRNNRNPRLLTTGPSRLCQALGITRDQDGLDLTRGKIVWIEDVDDPLPFEIFTTTRIGVTSGESLQLRFVWQDNDYASGPRRLRSPNFQK
jgi:DNA-3-methyladenine glycosylase